MVKRVFMKKVNVLLKVQVTKKRVACYLKIIFCKNRKEMADLGLKFLQRLLKRRINDGRRNQGISGLLVFSRNGFSLNTKSRIFWSCSGGDTRSCTVLPEAIFTLSVKCSIICCRVILPQCGGVSEGICLSRSTNRLRRKSAFSEFIKPIFRSASLGKKGRFGTLDFRKQNCPAKGQGSSE
jgi:hypothetical protein